jgi:hypothetical protein
MCLACYRPAICQQVINEASPNYSFDRRVCAPGSCNIDSERFGVRVP